jgi:hypothetical protein
MTDEGDDKTDEIREQAGDSDTLAVDGDDADGAVLTLDAGGSASGDEDAGEEGESADGGGSA